MVRLRDSWPFSLSSAPTVGNPCRPLQPESVSLVHISGFLQIEPPPRKSQPIPNTQDVPGWTLRITTTPLMYHPGAVSRAQGSTRADPDQMRGSLQNQDS